MEEVPGFVALAHELAHSYNSVKGFKNNDLWFMMGSEMIPTDEFFASVTENYIRNDHGLSIRTHYASEFVGGKEVPVDVSALFQSISPLSLPEGNGAPGIINYQYIDIWKMKF
jgi:hypothetical protein